MCEKQHTNRVFCKAGTQSLSIYASFIGEWNTEMTSQSKLDAFPCIVIHGSKKHQISLLWKGTSEEKIQGPKCFCHINQGIIYANFKIRALFIYLCIIYVALKSIYIFYSVFCRNEDVVAVELFDTSSDDIDINLNRILLLLPDEDMKPNLPKVHITELKPNFFEPRAETQSERFACQVFTAINKPTTVLCELKGSSQYSGNFENNNKV